MRNHHKTDRDPSLAKRWRRVIRTRLGLGLTITTAIAVVAAVLSTFAAPAGAAQINGAITNVTTSPTNPSNRVVTTTVDWCVPDGTQAGDTFSLTLSNFLTQLPAGFNLTDTSGNVVARATISAATPPVATFTMTAFAATHANVCGEAHFDSGLSSSIPAGTTVNVTDTTNDGQTFTTPVTPGGGGPNRNQAQKFGSFLTQDQGHTTTADVVEWYVESPLGPATSVTFTDNIPSGQTIDCASVRFRLGDTSGPNGSLNNDTNYTGATVTCTPTSITARTGAIASGKIVRMQFAANLTAATGDGSKTTFNNAATVQVTALNTPTKTFNPSSSITQAGEGGSGTGDVFSLGDYVWFDANKDGIQDTGEAPAPNVTVILKDSTGATVGTTTTDANGHYVFDNLLPDDYTVTFTAPSGFSFTTQTAGGDTTADSNPNSHTGVTGTVSLDDSDTNLTDSVAADGVTANKIDRTIDAGLIVTPVPGVTIVKKDAAGNDADTEATEATLPSGATGLVYTVTNSGTDALVDVTVTDHVVSGGTVTGLSCTFPDGSTGTTWPGPFAVGASFPCAAQLSGVVAGTTHQDIGTVTGTGDFTGTPVTDTNPYFATQPAYSLGDYVWFDANNNGIQDAGEDAAPNVTVILKDSAGATVGTTTTDANGHYAFDQLPAGDYTVTFTPPAGFSITTQNSSGSTAPNDSNPDRSTGVTATISLGATDANLTDSGPSDGVTAPKIDRTIDAGLIVIPVPEVTIVKKDAAGNDADTQATEATLPAGSTGLAYTITNNGNEALIDVTVSDTVVAVGTVTGLSCTFPDGSTGTTWPGPFAVAASFPCTAQLTGVTPSSTHEDIGTVTGTGSFSGTTVDDQNPYFATQPAYSLGDYVWYDANDNGIQDTGETPASGVTVVLKDQVGNTVGTTTTDSNGHYAFDELPAGDYTVTFTPPSGYTFTPAHDTGSTPTNDSNPNGSGVTETVSLGAGDTQLTDSVPSDGVTAPKIDRSIDAGLIQNPGPDVTIVKKDAAGNDADTQATETTLPNGSTGLVYMIANTGNEPLMNVTVSDTVVSIGTVTGLSCIFPDGSTGTTWAGPLAVGVEFPCTAQLSGVTAGALHEDIGTVTGTGLVSGTTVDDENPYYATQPAFSIGDYVWYDANDNGIQDTGETPASGVTVVLKDGNGATVGTTTTDSNGHYVFDQLPAGDYTVTFTPPSGYTFTPSGASGSSPTNDSNPNGGGVTRTINLGNNDAQLTDSTTSDGVTAPKIDRTIDAGLIQNPTPDVKIVKKDAAGNDADTQATEAKLPKGSTGLVYTITNNGSEPLRDVTVTDQLVAVGTVTGLSCTFPDGTKGTSWAGPLAAGASFPCTAQLAGVTPGSHHEDIGNVTGTGVISGTSVDDSNPYHATQPPYSIGNYVWYDTNDNGIQDKGEKPASGVTVVLKDSNGKTVGTTTTDSNGHYAFDQLPAGDYTITFTPPPGYSFTPTRSSGSTPTDDSNPNSNGITTTISLGDGDDQLTDSNSSDGVTAPKIDRSIDAGLIQTPAPGVSIVKKDANGNDADTGDTAVSLSDGSVGLVYTVTNNGNEPLTGITVSDQIISGGTVSGLTCTFPDGSTGLTWAGPFAAGGSFTCTGQLSGVPAGGSHEDIGKVIGEGVVSGKRVDSTNPYNAKRPAPLSLVDTGRAGNGSGPSIALISLGTVLVIAAAGAGSITFLMRRRRRQV
jgi:protocatechuate 3,4-dioxygenase beta subunit